MTGRLLRLAFSSALAATAVLAMTSCTSARNTLGTHDSPCFKVLPTATHAVGGHGSYRGVRFAPANRLVRDIHRQQEDRPGQPIPPALLAAEHQPTCLVEYRGTFNLSDLAAGWSPSGVTQGSYAVVVVRQRDATLVITVLLRREPLRFADFPA